MSFKFYFATVCVCIKNPLYGNIVSQLVFTGQTFVLSSEVNHNLRPLPLIHQLVESVGGTLAAVGGAGSTDNSVHYCPVVSVSQLIMTTRSLFVGW